jgi:hypothetical protein
MHITLGCRGSESNSARIVGHPELIAEVPINAVIGQVRLDSRHVLFWAMVGFFKLTPRSFVLSLAVLV